jgi:hypothetical protein
MQPVYLTSEPVFLTLKELRNPRNRFRQAGNRLLGSLKGLQIRAPVLRHFRNLSRSRMTVSLAVR